MRLHLLRHPQSHANVKGINDRLDGDLTETGIWQINRTVNRLACKSFDVVYTSPALRCVRLAEAIGQVLGKVPRVDFQLRERDYGSLTGKQGCELLDLGINDRPKGGESVTDVFERASGVLENLQGDNVLIVSHGLFLKMLVCVVIDMDVRTALASLKFSNCGVSLVEASTGSVEYLNDRTHLERTVRKIHVFGGWASGKTSLAKRLGKRFQLPVFHLDQLKYSDGFLQVRSVAQRIALLHEITASKEWITEGAWTDYANTAFDRADLLLYARTGFVRSLLLAVRREVGRKKPEGVSFLNLVAALVAYQYGNGRVSRKAHDGYFSHYARKAKLLGPDFEAAIAEDMAISPPQQMTEPPSNSSQDRQISPTRT